MRGQARIVAFATFNVFFVVVGGLIINLFSNHLGKLGDEHLGWVIGLLVIYALTNIVFFIWVGVAERRSPDPEPAGLNSLDRAAERLHRKIRDQWREEASLQGIADDQRLPVRWQNATANHLQPAR